MAHQSPGAGGSSTNTSSICQYNLRQSDSHPVRQYHSVCVHQRDGRFTLSSSVGAIATAVKVGITAQYSVEGDLSLRGGQLPN